ncbi:deoxyhypusine synthase [Candidatus Micrarchaeota archaeon]|nr:deoxyhypusine synthase [Candidatus Micrarchaeota archaeon]
MKVEDLGIGDSISETTGFQATELCRAVELIKEMKEDEDRTVFLAFTANMVASGLRGVFADLIRQGWVDVVVTSGGSADHDIIKSHLAYEIGSFGEDDEKIRDEYNRIGNLLVPNKAYELLEGKVQPLFKELYNKKKTWTSRELVTELSTLAKGEHSFLKACAECNVPVFSPALVDSAIGLQLFFFKQDHSDFVVDVTGDLNELANIVLQAKKTSAIILGGGPSKHLTLGCNLLRDGLDSAVYFTTAQEYDGSLSGAPPREAKSWKKLKGTSAVVYGDATITFPLALRTLNSF